MRERDRKGTHERGELVDVDVVVDGHLGSVDAEDVLPRVEVGRRDVQDAVEAARAHEGGILCSSACQRTGGREGEGEGERHAL